MADVPAAQGAFLRYLLGLVFLIPMIRPILAAHLTRRQLKLFEGRGVVHTIAVILWFYAMARIPIADVTAMNYLSPVYVTLGAALLLKEALPPRLATRQEAARPDATVICYAGDGGILMTGNELATAMRHNLAIVLIIANNSMYGTIRMHQERDYPGRMTATQLTNPDFVDWAKSFGALGERVETTAQFAPAFERALAAEGPAVIELIVSEELLSSNMTLTQMRERVAAANAD